MGKDDKVFKQLTKFTYALETLWRQMKGMGWGHQMRYSNQVYVHSGDLENDEEDGMN